MQTIRSASRRFLLAAALAVFAAVPAAAQPSAQEIVDRYVQAIGGREKALSFQSRALTYVIDAGSGTMQVQVRMRRPNLGTSTMSTPMGEVRTGTTGDVVWAIGPAGAQVVEGPQAEDIRTRMAFDADILFDVYPTLETAGSAEYEGRKCWKVRMVTAANNVTVRCFDVETGLVVATTQLLGGMEVTAITHEYREFDGLKYPARNTASAMGSTVTTTLLSVSHADIPAAEFALPAEVRAVMP